MMKENDHLGNAAAAAAAPHNTSSYSTDQEALLALKTCITYDPHNALASNWSSTTPVCSWIGISCDPIRPRVTNLNLSNMGLQGTIPPHIANLSFLAVLDLSNNSFHGPLRRELVSLRRLTRIDLGHNNFTGAIPNILSNMSSLQYVSLIGNKFNGSLSDEFFENLPNLQQLALGYNLLVGQIPSSLWKCKKLLNLYLHRNKFSGSIPMDVANLTLLNELALSENHLTGMFSVGHFSFQILILVYYFRQLISAYINYPGNIPDNIGELRNLEALWLIHTNKSDELHLPTVVICRWQQTYWCGKSDLQAFVKLKKSFHILPGTLPTNIGELRSLEEIYLWGNKLYGNIPNSIGNASKLIFIYFGENSFSGSVPSSVGNLRELEDLGLHSNQLTGDLNFISSLASCKNLTRL
ncbi:hypothetical protein Tsubulata_042024, partial [Turnera subulata]